MTDKFIICVLQHQALFDKWHANNKDNDLNTWQSIADQLGSVDGNDT